MTLRNRTASILVLGLCAQVAPSIEAQLLVAHRGASAEAPENTLAAFRLAWQRGADAIEGDFWLSKDGEIVCIHDATTERVSASNLRVKDSTLAELRRLDVGIYRGPGFKGERIPTLDEVLNTVPEHGRIFIEVKCGPEIVPALKEVLGRAKFPSSQVAVISFDSMVIHEVRRRMPHIAAHWLTGYERDKESGEWHPTEEEVLATLKRIQASGLDTHANLEIVDAGFVQRLRANKLEVHCWTVNDPLKALKLRELGVDSITTDRPRWLRDNLPSVNLREHLLLHLPLDQDLRDASDREHHAQWTDGSGTSFAHGVFGSAAHPGDSQASIRVAVRLPSEGTLALWVRPEPWYDYQTIFDNSCGENDWEMWIYGDALLAFRLHGKGPRHTHALHATGDVREWIHLAVSWRDVGNDQREVILYVDGRASEEAPPRNVPWKKPGEFFYLAGGHNGNDKGRCAFDDLMIFDRPLDRGDVRTIMALGPDSVKARER